MPDCLYEPQLCDPIPSRPRLRGGWRSVTDLLPYPRSGTSPTGVPRTEHLQDYARPVSFLPEKLGEKQTAIMGILNVTPDSFSDGGEHDTPALAIAHGVKLIEAGVDILDIGGESTRPGADPVDPQEEIRRVVPVIRELANRGLPLSIDSRHAVVMEAALAAGARILNDITALEGDPDALSVARRGKTPVILMHMRGADPRTMQQNPTYADVVTEVYRYLEQRLAALEQAGISRDRICVDPGIGFGKTVDHNLQLMRHLPVLHGLGRPILLGASRKRFIASVSANEAPKDRLAGSLAAAISAFTGGIQILRVHDVVETLQARAVWFSMHS